MNAPGKVLRLAHITTIPRSMRWFSGQLSFMKRRGFDVHAISSPGKLLLMAETEEIPLHTVSMTRKITPLQDLLAIARMFLLLRRLRPEIVHSHTPKAGLLGMSAAFLARTPVRIYHVHGLRFVTLHGWKRHLLRLAEKIACALSHEVFCVSQSVRRLAIAEGLCRESKIRVLLHGSISGIDARERFNPANFPEDVSVSTRAKLGISPKDLIIGFVGRIVRDKGWVELAAAWLQLREEFSSLQLLVVGKFEEEDPVPDSVRELLSKDPRIHCTGYVEDPRHLLLAMDLLVLPSYREGFALTLLEAGALALPVVATAVPGCLDPVSSGETGTLVPPGDARALREAIQAYLVDPELRRQHGQAARRRMLTDYAAHLVWETTYREYVRLLAQKGIQAPVGPSPPVDR